MGKISRCERGREYHGCGDECNIEKRKKGSNTIFPIIFRLLGRILSEERGRKRTFRGRKSRFKKMGMRKKIKLWGTLYTPVFLGKG